MTRWSPKPSGPRTRRSGCSGRWGPSPTPNLLAAAQHALSSPAAEFAEYTEHARGHGRTEERILRTAPVTTTAPIDFPHAAQVFRVIRYVGDLDGQRHSKEVAYCITSLNTDKATGHDLGQLLRLTGWNNLKQARRHFSHAIHRCVNLITKPVKTVKNQT